MPTLANWKIHPIVFVSRRENWFVPIFRSSKGLKDVIHSLYSRPNETMVVENFHIFGTMTVARQAATCRWKTPRGPCCGSTENEPFFHGKNMENCSKNDQQWVFNGRFIWFYLVSSRVLLAQQSWMDKKPPVPWKKWLANPPKALEGIEKRDSHRTIAGWFTIELITRGYPKW